MKLIDGILNRFTMYFVVLWSLRFLVACSIIFSFLGFLSFKPLNLIFSFLLLVGVCYLANKVLARIFKVAENKESYDITALILYLILIPIDSAESALIFIIAAGAAMGSKYILAINKRHIFNPAAFGLFVIGVMGSGLGLWWIGNKFMFPLVLILGLLIVRKVRRFHLFLSFLTLSVASILFFAILNKANPFEVLPLIITSYPILFLATVMLTEPLTTPPSKRLQMVYGGIVGVLSGAQFHIGPIFATPELALLLGNIFSYSVSFKYRLILTLREKIQISPNIYEFIFKPNVRFVFSAGQYMEWTLVHKKSDTRGARRYFTLASSPAEEYVRIGVRINPQKRISSFKNALLNLAPGTKLYAGQLSGDFVLPKRERKYVFFAGGIGATPFRSIVKSMLDKDQKLDAVLFYSSTDERDFVYKDIFEKASSIGLKTICVCSQPTKAWKGKTGRVDAKLLRQEVPDYKNRTYYLSGPNSMVEGYKNLLRGLRIRPDNIVTDYFPGY